jgi:hypothetical protein
LDLACARKLQMRSIASVLLNQRCQSAHSALLRAFSSARYCSPGLWAALAVSSRAEQLSGQALLDLLGQHSGYGKAIGIEEAIGEQDTYSKNRSNQGVNYSPLVVLDDVDKTNQATRDIAGCIRNWFTDPCLALFTAELCDVVGDLHDNVWSHALSTGVSMAQKWQDGDGPQFEFALADRGIGLLAELRRSGVASREGIQEAIEAISWCIVRGNSSKIKEEDPWAQSLPQDATGNPMGPIARHRTNGNNHLGLGLAKLVELVTKFKGLLWLASGNAMLTIDKNGVTKRQTLPFEWSGVVLSCRFSVSSVLAMGQVVEKRDELDELLDTLLKG